MATKKPAKGKRFVKVVKNSKTGRTKKVSYGQAGKAKSGGDRIRPGTAKGDATVLEVQVLLRSTLRHVKLTLLTLYQEKSGSVKVKNQ